MNVVYVYADSQVTRNSMYWREENFADALNRHGHTGIIIPIVKFVQPDVATSAILGEADLIVIQRSAIGQVIDMAVWCKQNLDAAVVIDLDDDYYHLKASNPSYRHWILGEVPAANGGFLKLPVSPIKQLQMAGRLLDGYIMPTTKLAEQWEPYGPCYVIPNYPNLGNYIIDKRDNGDQIVFGWGGSYSHLDSMINSGFLTGLERAVMAIPNLQVEIATAEKGIFDALRVPVERKTLLPWVPYEQWPQYLGRWDLTAAIGYDLHDTYRSELHIVEPALVGLPVVASDIQPYNQYWAYVAAFTKNTPSGWAEQITMGVKSIATMRDYANSMSKPWAQTWSIDRNIDLIVATYKEIIAVALYD